MMSTSENVELHERYTESPIDIEDVTGPEPRRDLFFEHALYEEETGSTPELRQARYQQFRKLNELLAFTLKNTRLAHLAPHVLSCHTVFRGYHCSSCAGDFAGPVGSCTVRLCAFHMRSRAMRALHRFRKAIDNMPAGKYLVLAERNCGVGDLKRGIASLFAAWNRLRRMAIWHGVHGAIVVLEVTYNREKQTWHPHLNVVFDGPYIPHEQLLLSWQKATEGRGRTAFIRKTDRGTAVELLKYVTKLFNFIDVPVAVEDFLLATQRCRFIRTYGTFYNLKAEENAKGHIQCPDCGSSDVSLILSALLPQQVYVDRSGVLRIHLWAYRPRMGAPPRAAVGIYSSTERLL